jgi:hypothetical protein
MKNEQRTQNRQGVGSGIETPMAALSATGRLQQGTEPGAGRKGSDPQQVALRSCGYAADSFLKHQFLPLYEAHHSLQNDNTITGGVLNSLSILAVNHSISLLDVSDKPYPYNILLAHWNAQKQLQRTPGKPELFIIEDEARQIKMATRQTASRSYSLYYIPVLPLYRLLKSRENKTGAQLLLSVFAYLYQVAGIPYYRDPDAYLFYHYEMMEEWLTDEDDGLDDKDRAFNRKALDTASHGGDVIQRILYHPAHLEQFAERVADASPENGFEQGCLKVAQTALTLWHEFPSGDIFSHLHSPYEDCDDDEDWTGHDNTIHVAEYVHFIADTESSLYDSIQQNIDAELNEKMYWEEHSLLSVYDENYSPNADSLDFENGLFRLLDDLSYLLNELP